MTSSNTPTDGGESIARITEDDVEGHIARATDDGESIARATEDDVEGHIARATGDGESIARRPVTASPSRDRPRTTSRATSPAQTDDGESIARATEDDVEGHIARATEDGESIAPPDR